MLLRGFQGSGERLEASDLLEGRLVRLPITVHHTLSSNWRWPKGYDSGLIPSTGRRAPFKWNSIDYWTPDDITYSFQCNFIESFFISEIFHCIKGRNTHVKNHMKGTSSIKYRKDILGSILLNSHKQLIPVIVLRGPRMEVTFYRTLISSNWNKESVSLK